MKKTLITLFVALVSFTTALADNDRAIQFNQLPQAAQTFLNSHFKNAKIAMVTAEREWLGQEYKVVFVNGDKIEFDSKGNWENIECKHSTVPKGAVPTAISKYLRRYRQISTDPSPQSSRRTRIHAAGEPHWG